MCTAVCFCFPLLHYGLQPTLDGKPYQVTKYVLASVSAQCYSFHSCSSAVFIGLALNKRGDELKLSETMRIGKIVTTLLVVTIIAVTVGEVEFVAASAQPTRWFFLSIGVSFRLVCGLLSWVSKCIPFFVYKKYVAIVLVV